LERFVAIRATTSDRLPLVGPLDDGLWINAGHGAHGLMTAPLAAIRLARWIARGKGPRPRAAPTLAG
jgi:glycine/D-amino acid oxidase-like deaminating enzyme